MFRHLTFVCLLTAVACSEEDPTELTLDTALCGRLQNGPATSLMATTSTRTAPAALLPGMRLDVTLPSQSSGSLAFNVDAPVRYAFGLTQDLSMVVVRNGGPVIVADELRLDRIACPDLVTRRVYSFETGGHTITLGPAEADTVNFTFEPYPADE